MDKTVQFVKSIEKKSNNQYSSFVIFGIVIIVSFMVFESQCRSKFGVEINLSDFSNITNLSLCYNLMCKMLIGNILYQHYSSWRFRFYI